VDDFEAIVWLHLSCIPVRARKNFEVAFKGHAFENHIQIIKQRRDGQSIGNFSAVAINRDGLAVSPGGPALARERIVNRISSFPISVIA
jgi:hypothetical protein